MSDAPNTPLPRVNASAAEPVPLDLPGTDVDAADPMFQALAQAFLDGSADNGDFLKRAESTFPPAPTPTPTDPALGADAGATGEASVAAAGDALPPPQPLPRPTAEQRPIDTTPPVTSYDVTLPGGETVTLTADDVQTLLGLNQWAQTLTPQQRADLYAVEQGTAVPVSNDEYRTYQQWLQNRDAPAPAPSPAPARPAFNPQDFEDPNAAQAIASLNDELTTLRTTVAALEQRPDPVSVVTAAQQQQQAVDRDLAVINRVAAEYAGAHQLTDDEIGELYAVATQHKLLGNNVRPGQTPDQYAQAVYATLDQASWLSPTVRSKMIQSQADAQLAREREAMATVDAKKARASSLSSVPSAAVTVPSRDPNATATPQQQEAEIASFIRELGVGATN